MPKLTYYAEGTWNGTCDQCGLGFKFNQLSKRWDNAYVCSQCWEPRHPQDFVRAVRDDPSVPVARPRILNFPSSLFWSTTVANPLPWTNSTGVLITWTGN